MRCVVIHHPDFNAEKGVGIKAAMEVVDQYKQGNNAMMEELKKKGIPQSELEKFQRWASQIRYFIRNIEE